VGGERPARKDATRRPVQANTSPWEGGSGERIPAWCRRVVQDERTKISAPRCGEPEEKYRFKHLDFKADTSPLLIYETHVGMATEEERVGTYNEFRENVLPRA